MTNQTKPNQTKPFKHLFLNVRYKENTGFFYLGKNKKTHFYKMGTIKVEKKGQKKKAYQNCVCVCV